MRHPESIISAISRINDKSNKLLIAELKKNNIEGLVPSHGGILVHLYRTKGDVNLKEVAEFIGKDKSTVTALVNKLIKHGYITKNKNSEDKRNTYISLTKKGKELESVIKNISKHVLETVYAGFEDDEKVVLINMLDRVLNNL